LPKISHTVEIRAPRDRVWEIISDLENEPEYWYGTKEVRTISREGNVVEREITQNFRNHRIRQRAVLRPKDSVEIHYLKGLTEGMKVVSIQATSEDVQLLNAFWDVHFPGIYKLVSPLIRRHIENGTKNALARIKSAAEGTPVSNQSAEGRDSHRVAG
jgi:hypothetical protein